MQICRSSYRQGKLECAGQPPIICGVDPQRLTVSTIFEARQIINPVELYVRINFSKIIVSSEAVPRGLMIRDSVARANSPSRFPGALHPDECVFPMFAMLWIIDDGILVVK